MGEFQVKLIKFIYDSSKNLRTFIVILFLCSFAVAIDANIRPYLIKLMIDNTAKSFELSGFVVLAGLFFASQIFVASANALQDWMGTKFHTRYRKRITHHFLNKLTNYPFKFFEDNHIGSITSNITDAFNIIPMLIFRFSDIFIQFFLLTTIAMFLLSSVSIYFVMLAFIWIIIFVILTIFFFKRYQPLNDDYATCRPKIFGFLSDYFTNIRSVWCYSNSDNEKRDLEKITDEFVEKSTKCGVFLRNYYAVYGFILALYMGVILYILGELSLSGKINPGDFALVFMINYKISDSLLNISNNIRSFLTNFGQASNAIKLLDSKITIRNSKNAKKLIVKNPEIKFSNVNFHYLGSKKEFNYGDLTIKPKEKVGLVGYSGSGKSSFVNLIMRLYDFQNGKIYIDNHDIKKVTLESLRDNIGLIPQNPSLFNRSIFDNISYGKKNASMKDVELAAKKAKAHEFIKSLPKGYHTMVGNRGIKLSGGQRQRIAIARAILKDAPILILDEATSQLDSINEKLIQSSMDELTKAKTTLVIAHRLSTLKEMDRILVFDDGQIVEDGTHEALLKKNGLYKKLWHSQIDGMLPRKDEEII